MTRKTITFVATLMFACAALLSACASKTSSTSLYDFGPLHAAGQGPASLPAVSIADIGTPTWLDNTSMYFRLTYDNDQQPRPYAHSRWSMPPTELFAQRLKARIAQAGGAALPASAGAINVPVLRIEADEFMQTFEAPDRSSAEVSMRAALFNGRELVAQKAFMARVPAPSADAAGGARALASASDDIIMQMMRWLAALPASAQATK